MPPLARLAALLLLAAPAAAQGAAPAPDQPAAAVSPAERARRLHLRIRHELVAKPLARLQVGLRLPPSQGDRVREVLEAHAADVFRRFAAGGLEPPPAAPGGQDAERNDFRLASPLVLSRIVELLEPTQIERFLLLIGEAKQRELQELNQRRARGLRLLRASAAGGGGGKGKGKGKGKKGKKGKGLKSLFGGAGKKSPFGGGGGGGRRRGRSPFG